MRCLLAEIHPSWQISPRAARRGRALMPGRDGLWPAVTVIIALMAATAISCGRAGAAVAPDWSALPALLKRIHAPVFPNKDFDVTRHGAVADGKTDCHKAITAAIDACSKVGGGRVLLPAGDYLSNGPLHLKSNINLHLAAGATLRFGVNPEDYLVGESKFGGGVLTRWEGTRCYNYSPLIYAYRQKNIALSGAGIIDGQASLGWAEWFKRQLKDKETLRGMGAKQTPLAERLFGRGHFLRPSLFQVYECENILVEGVTIKGSPFWTIHPVLSRNITIRHVSVEPGTTNDDGCDPESCSDVLIDGCKFSTADDNIAIKSGRDQDGWAAHGGKPCQNILIRNCQFLKGTPGGLSIGSEMSGDVRNVFVEKCIMGKVERPVYIKCNPDRGGIVENIRLRDLTIGECAILLKIEMNYKERNDGPFPPDIHGIHLDQVTCEKAKTAIDCVGLPGHLLRDIRIRKLTVTTCEIPLAISHAEKLSLDQVTINGQLVN